MRIHFVLLGDATVASTRVRCLGLIERLTLAGHRVTSTSSKASMLKKLFGLMLGRQLDVIVVQKVVPPRFVSLVLRKKCRVLVVEIDDAIHLGYPGENGEVTAKRNRRLPWLLKNADLLTTPSPVIAADFARQVKKAFVHPGPAPVISAPDSNKESRALWLGSPSTEDNLGVIGNVGLFTEAAGMIAVGATNVARELGYEVRTWNPEVEEEELERCSVGLMPQKRSPWNDRKSAYKVLEYMSHGLVPIANETPSLDALGNLADFIIRVETVDGWRIGIKSALNVEPQRVLAAYQAAQNVNQDAYCKSWLSVVGEVLQK